jgi:hypothetical protein
MPGWMKLIPLCRNINLEKIEPQRLRGKKINHKGTKTRRMFNGLTGLIGLTGQEKIVPQNHVNTEL